MLGHHALGIMALSGISDAIASTTTETTLHFATRTFATRSTDAPAHTNIEGRLARGLQLDRRLTSAEDGQFGSLIETRFGEIELNNSDGALDSYVDQYAADGREIRLKIGAVEISASGRRQVKTFSTFALVYTSVAGGWTFEHNVVRLRIESLANRLNRRIQQQVYAGSGGRQGTADMAGRTLPLAFGHCDYVTPQLVDPWILTYQVHAGAINNIGAVYDSGVGVSLTVDYPTYTGLAEAALAPGTYATCVAEGFFRLGSIPVGEVTADVSGDRDNTTGEYVGTHAAILRMIYRDYAGFLNSELDLTSFTTFNDAQPAEIGLFLPAGDQSTIIDIAEQIAFSGGAFTGQDRSGLMRIQRLDPPGETANWFFTDRDIPEGGIERETPPYGGGRGIPYMSWGVRYGVNWTLQRDSDLATGVSQERRLFLQQEGRYAYSQSSDIALYHRSSSGAPLRQSFFVSQADAQAEANRLLAFYSYGRALYRVTVKTALFSMEIGQTARIMYDRWTLRGGKNFVVLAIADNADRVETEFLAFG